MRLLLFMFTFLFLAYACTEQTDSQVSGGNFTVHFSNTDDKELAEKIVHFWKDEALLTDKKQDVKLVKTKDGYDLYLISPTRKSMKELTFEEIKSLTTLRMRLEKEVFKDQLVRLVITDENFKPIFTPDI